MLGYTNELRKVMKQLREAAKNAFFNGRAFKEGGWGKGRAIKEKTIFLSHGQSFSDGH